MGSVEWSRARCFIRNRYGGGDTIKEMIPPLGITGTWTARIVQGKRILKVDFERGKGLRQWAILREVLEDE